MCLIATDRSALFHFSPHSYNPQIKMDSACFSPIENNLIDLLEVMNQVELFHLPEACVVPQNHPTVAEILQEIENPVTQTHMDSNQHRVQRLTSSFIPMQPQRAQDDPSYMSILPQPGFPPELIITPCSPPDVCWPNSTFGCGPRVLVPIISPPELCGPGMPRRSWLLLPEGHPVWCLCPQEVPLNRPCSADMRWGTNSRYIYFFF